MATKSPEQILSEASEVVEILRPISYLSASLGSLIASQRMLASAIKFAREREVDLSADIAREASAAAGLTTRLVTEFKEACDAEQAEATKQIKRLERKLRKFNGESAQAREESWLTRDLLAQLKYARDKTTVGWAADQRRVALLRLAIRFPEVLRTLKTALPDRKSKTAGKTEAPQKICAAALRVSEACPTGVYNSPVKDLNNEFASLKRLLAAPAESAAAVGNPAAQLELQAELVAHFTEQCIVWVRAAYGEDSREYAAVRDVTRAGPKRNEQEKLAPKPAPAKPSRRKLVKGAASN